MAEPTLHYEVTIRFPCQAVAFLAGLLTPVIGSALLGIGALVGIELAKELVDPNVPTPQQQPSPVPTIGGVRWSSLAIAQEGLLLQGDVDAERFSDAPTLQGLCDFNF